MMMRSFLLALSGVLLATATGCGFISESMLHPVTTPPVKYTVLPPLGRLDTVIPPDLLGNIRHRTAIIVGVGKYANSNKGGLTDLRFASSDSDAFAFHLMKSGFNVVKTFSDQKATLENIRGQIREVASRASEDDLVLIYWAGHCCPDPRSPQDLYLVTYNTDLTDMRRTAYSITSFRNDITNIAARRLLVVVDTCHSGGIGSYDPGVAMKGSSVDILEAMRGVYIDTDQAATRIKAANSNASRAEFKGRAECPMRMVFAASQQGEVSFEDSQLEHGVFTYYLLKGLQGDADDQANGGNGDGTVTLYEAIKYTQANVKRFSHDRQNPAIAGTYDASIPLGVRK